MDLALRRRLAKPTYLHRPDQLARRLRTPKTGTTVVTLPWGMPLEVDVTESVGSGIARTGVHELAVTEIAWRLTGRDDLAVDVGANIGYMTALFAARARETVALEPHPVVIERLRRNADRWPGLVHVVQAAASSQAGSATLTLPEDFPVNHGMAEIGEGPGIPVQTVTLDGLLDGREIGVLKVDVEGHELAVFQGSKGLLRARRIRDVLFEDLHAPPTAVTDLIQRHGYTLFGLREGMVGVRLVPPLESKERWSAPTYLATRDPGRALRLMQSRGWRSLRPRARA